MFPLLDWPNRQRYFDFGEYPERAAPTSPICPAGVDTRQLPEDCHEAAHTPQELFEKLAQWGFDTLVIPARHDLGLLHAARLDAGTSSSRRRSTIPTARR